MTLRGGGRGAAGRDALPEKAAQMPPHAADGDPNSSELAA